MTTVFGVMLVRVSVFLERISCVLLFVLFVLTDVRVLHAHASTPEIFALACFLCAYLCMSVSVYVYRVNVTYWLAYRCVVCTKRVERCECIRA